MSINPVSILNNNLSALVLNMTGEALASCQRSKPELPNEAVKKMTTREKVVIAALTIFTALTIVAGIAAIISTFPIAIPITLGSATIVGTIAFIAYKINQFQKLKVQYPFLQDKYSGGQVWKTALEMVGKGDFIEAEKNLKSLLVPKYADINNDAILINSGDGLGNVYISDMKKLAYPTIRCEAEGVELFPLLYSSILIWTTKQKINSGKITSNEINEAIKKITFWGSKIRCGLPKEQKQTIAELQKIADGQTNTISFNQNAKPEKIFGILTFLECVDNLSNNHINNRVSSLGSLEEIIQSLRSLEPAFKKDEIGKKGYQLYQDMKKSKDLTELKNKAQSFPKDEIQRLENLVAVNLP